MTGLTALRRAELHLRFGEALERSGGGRDVAELAYHFAAAAPFGGTARGVEYNVLAARAAAAALDFDDAAERLRVALELGVQEPLERGELLLELGGAGHRGGRRSTLSRRSPRRRRSAAPRATPTCSRGPPSATRRPAGGR